MKITSKTALGGIIVALSVVIMFLSIIPLLTYTLPAIAGALIIFMVIEANKGAAFLTYLAAGVLSFLVAPDREAAIMYVFFFGYYPIIKAIFESRLPRVIEWILKFVVFNLSMIVAYFVSVYIFLIPFEEMEDFGAFTIPILLFAGNLMFFLYDLALTKFIILYDRRIKKTFRKIFK